MQDEFTPCDRCAHRSYVFALLPNGGELTYCGHHGRKYKPGLLKLGAIVDDYSYTIG